MDAPQPTSTPPSVRVFLSYARGDDEPFVRRLYDDLIRAGFTVWFDRAALMARGRTFHHEIEDAIRTEVDRIVYVGGPKAALSAYVREEWQFGLEFDQVVVTPDDRQRQDDHFHRLAHRELDRRTVASAADLRVELQRSLGEILPPAGVPFTADIGRIIRYAPAELSGRENELTLLNDAWDKAVRSDQKRPHLLTFVALSNAHCLG